MIHIIHFTATKVGGACSHLGSIGLKVGGALAPLALWLPRPWYCLSSSTHPAPVGVLPKPQTGSLVDNFIRRSVKSGFCPEDLQSFGVSARGLRKNCFIRFWTIQYTFYVSYCCVSLLQARITTSDHANTMKNYRTKRHICLNAIS